MTNIKIDGIFIPSQAWLDLATTVATASEITDEYAGLSINVSYRVKLNSFTVAERDTIDVQGDGTFEFILPEKSLIVDEQITLEVRAPSGIVLMTLSGDVDSFAHEDVTSTDTPIVKAITLDPVSPEDIISTAAHPSKISFKGRVLDHNGHCSVAGLQVVIWALPLVEGGADTEDTETEHEHEHEHDLGLAESGYMAIFAGTTDKDGYFFGSYKPGLYARVFAVVGGDKGQASEINITTETGFTTLNAPILVFVDGEALKDAHDDDGDCGCDAPSAPMADADQIAQNPESFAQDLGGGCVNFTIPDRTVEEHRFYSIVRTVDQRIKGLTFNAKDIQVIRTALRKSIDDLCNHVERFDAWKNDLTLVDPEQIAEIPNPQPNTGAGTGVGAGTTTGTASGVGLGEVATPEVTTAMDASTSSVFDSGVNLEAVSTDASVIIPQAVNLEREAVLPPQQRREIMPRVAALTARAYTSPYITSTLLLPTGYAQQTSQRGQTLAPGLVQRRQLNSRKNALSRNVNTIQAEKEALKAKINEKLQQDITLWSLSDVLTCQDSFKAIEDLITRFITVVGDYRSMITSHSSAFMSADMNYINDFESVENILRDHANGVQRHLSDIERAYAMAYPGRNHVSLQNPIHWDDDLQVYHNTTIGHGHLLCYKQAWKSAGYSIGNLQHSLALAPGQKKNIAVFSWDRSESASRSEIQTNEERLTSHMNRDRGISEIMNSAFSEKISASSSASTEGRSGSVGGGIGFAMGPVVIGVAGGYTKSSGSASSSSSQSAARNFAASSSNQLSDSIKQAASSVRSQRSTVVQTVDQAESMGVTTEVISNHNMCHAITIQHFEVLRHLVVEQCLAEVSECLFVPCDMSPFTFEKVLRWKHHLHRAMIDGNLISGFDALERIATKYHGSPFKDIEARFADEDIEHFTGDLQISFEFERPYIAAIEDGGDEEAYITHYLHTYKGLFGWTSLALRQRIAKRFIPYSEDKKDEIFEKDYAPDIAREFVDNLQILGEDANGQVHNLNLDITMVGRYRKGHPIYVRLNSGANTPRSIRRADIERLIVKSPSSVEGMSRIMLHSIRMNYQSEHQSGRIVQQRNVLNDIVNEDSAIFYTPLSSQEKVRPQDRDTILATRLLDHLNEYIEFYHKAIWMNMDPCRLFGLLDGFIAPNAQGRSVASVVENRIIGVIGNNLILKVAPGFNLDPNFRVREGVNLLDHYMPLTPPKPFRISIPTPGTYTESVMGACNSCEHIDESRFWRVNEMPNPNEPTAIQPIGTDSRRADSGNLQSKGMESPIINIQNAPAAPDPTGLGAAIGLMGTAGIFENMTGLEGNQANALGALQSAAASTQSTIQAAQNFAKMGLEARAMQLADANRNNRKDMNEVDRLESEGKISPEDAEKRRLNILDRKDKATSTGEGNNGGAAEEGEEDKTKDGDDTTSTEFSFEELNQASQDLAGDSIDRSNDEIASGDFVSEHNHGHGEVV